MNPFQCDIQGDRSEQLKGIKNEGKRGGYDSKRRN